jgi:bacteriorhodopsin
MTPQFWLWLNTIAMAAGAAAILFLGKRRVAGEEAHTIYHGIVPIIAALSYLAMAAGQGVVPIAVALIDDPSQSTDLLLTRTFYYARYIDWAFTTPLLLLPLALVAIHSRARHLGLIAGLLLADLMMIVTALFFGLSVVPWIKWTWFLVSCGAFAAVYWVMWVPLRQQAALERADVQDSYRSNALILSALWLIYPIILFLGTDGLGVFSETVSVALIAIIDFVSKVAYGLYAIRGFGRIVDRDLSGRAATPGTATDTALPGAVPATA